MSIEDQVPNREDVSNLLNGVQPAVEAPISRPVIDDSAINMISEPTPAAAVAPTPVEAPISPVASAPVVAPAQPEIPVREDSPVVEAPIAQAPVVDDSQHRVAVSAKAKVDAVPEAEKVKVKRDLSNLQIVKAGDLTSLDLHEAIKQANNRSRGGTFQAVALKSGYAFEVNALGFSAIERLLTSSASALAETQKLIKTAYEQIAWFSCGNLSYEQFIACTAFDDLDTIYYAIYAATYPGTNSYPIPCEHCSHENTVQVSVNQLISNIGNESLRRVSDVLSQAFSSRRIVETMPLETANRIELEDSGAVVQYGIASIADYLNGLDQVSSVLIDRSSGRPTVGREEIASIVQCQLGIDALYIPLANDPSRYVEVNVSYDVSNFIKTLSKTDGATLKKEMVEIQKEYEVEFSIPKFHCSQCAKQNSERPLDFERILFIRLNQERAG